MLKNINIFPISNKSYIFAESNLKIIKDMKVESKEKNGSKNIYYKSLYEYKKFYEKLLLFVIIAIQKHERAKRLEGGTLYLIFPKVDLWLRTTENDTDDQYMGNANVLINDEARLQGRDKPVQNTSGTSVSTSPSDNGQVSYQEGNETSQSVPLISDDRYKKNNTKQVVVPPPPPSSSSSSNTASSGNTPKTSTNSGSNSSKNSGNNNSNASVPQLF